MSALDFFLEEVRRFAQNASIKRHFGMQLKKAIGKSEDALHAFREANPLGLFLVRFLADTASARVGWKAGMLVEIELTDEYLNVHICNSLGIESFSFPLDELEQFYEWNSRDGTYLIVDGILQRREIEIKDEPLHSGDSHGKATLTANETCIPYGTQL